MLFGESYPPNPAGRGMGPTNCRNRFDGGARRRRAHAAGQLTGCYRRRRAVRRLRPAGSVGRGGRGPRPHYHRVQRCGVAGGGGPSGAVGRSPAPPRSRAPACWATSAGPTSRARRNRPRRIPGRRRGPLHNAAGVEPDTAQVPADPQRIVVLSGDQLDALCALGLQSRIVGAALPDGVVESAVLSGHRRARAARRRHPQHPRPGGHRGRQAGPDPRLAGADAEVVSGAGRDRPDGVHRGARARPGRTTCAASARPPAAPPPRTR